ncbi:MAG: hypothetical protein ABSE63_14635 [Thermoguttaceae bacterium]|jgi:hypothetical protein
MRIRKADKVCAIYLADGFTWQKMLTLIVNSDSFDGKDTVSIFSGKLGLGFGRAA